jgi:hypothetical protein
MTRLTFNKELYATAAIAEAVAAFEPHAQLSRSETDTEWHVDVQADADETLIADEFSNFALGVTIERNGAAG